jgi:predicted nucleic acid-binding protein
MILQEILSGVRSRREFERLREKLGSVPLLPVTRATHEAAAQLCNLCRSHGIAASHVDFLIAAACIEYGCPLLTADRDFGRIADHSDLVLVPPEPDLGRRN